MVVYNTVNVVTNTGDLYLENWPDIMMQPCNSVLRRWEAR